MCDAADLFCVRILAFSFRATKFMQNSPCIDKSDQTRDNKLSQKHKQAGHSADSWNIGSEVQRNAKPKHIPVTKRGFFYLLSTCLPVSPKPSLYVPQQ